MQSSVLKEYVRAHQTSHYGATGDRSLPYILAHIRALRPRTILDYGCGQSDVADLLERKIRGVMAARYDPAIPAFAEPPAACVDLLVSIDVLEHVPEEELSTTIADMAKRGSHAIIVIDTAPAVFHLMDGRNAHVSQHDQTWWLDRLQKAYPKIRPIKIGMRNRVCFKTFDQDPGTLIVQAVFIYEWIARHLRKRRRKLLRMMEGNR